VPDWKETLWEAVFGRDWQSTYSSGVEKRATVCLLARLAVDPHAGLDEAVRVQALDCCLEWEVAQQKAEESREFKRHVPEALRILFSVDPGDQTRLLERLVDRALAVDIRLLDLSGTGVRDLGPLAALTGLQGLYLNSTAVTDLGPLAALTALRSLDLDGTGVKDLGPLAALTELQELDLDNTRVTNLGPLAALRGLIILYLANTGVTDLGPLEGLTALKGIYLRGTGVTDEQVAKLLSESPRISIFPPRRM
jgi:Leucine-rich repeat (LRR) protein